MAWNKLLPPTNRRVELNTAPEVNARNRQRLAEDVKEFEGASAAAISRRIDALEREWDIERVLEANAAVVTLIGLGLGFGLHRRWFWLPVAAMCFLLEHAVQGWCPPVVPWRRAGVRTQTEIHNEITALRLLRGDLEPTSRAREAVARAIGKSRR